MQNTPRNIIVHHDGVSREGPSLKAVDDYHKQREFPLSELGFYVGYHWVIERNGKPIRTRHDHEIGAHTIGLNDKSIGIYLAGNFDVEMPTEEQVRSLGILLTHYCRLYRLDEDDIFPHRKFANKTCYGKKLGDHWAALVYLQNEQREVQLRIDNLPAD